MTVKNYLKSALTLACVACLSITTFAKSQTANDGFSGSVIQDVRETIVINSNHAITVEGNIKHFNESLYNNDPTVRISVSWLNESTNRPDFTVTEVINYTENGMKVKEVNIFSERDYDPSSGTNVKNEIIDGKKYIENRFKCFSLQVDAAQEAGIISVYTPNLELLKEFWYAGPYNNKTQSYNPTKISKRSVFRGISFKSDVYWFKYLNNIAADGSVNPNYLDFESDAANVVSTTRVILKLAGSQKNVGMFAHNFKWTLR